MLSRALHLARREFPFFQTVRAGPAGHLDGLQETLREVDPGLADLGLIALLTHSIDLLVGFIGEELTLRLVGEVWPDPALVDPIGPDTIDNREAAS